MAIHCMKCKSVNPPSAEKCQTCGADLLPGFGKSRKMVGVIAGFLAMIWFGYMGIMGLKSPHPLYGYALMVIGIAIFIFTLWAIRKGQPLFLRYESRAKRHLEIDPEQAYADFTKAIRLAPWSFTAYQARNSLYDRVNLSLADIHEEIELLTRTLKTSKASRGKLREVLAHEIVELSKRQIDREREAGLATDSLKHTIQLLDFMEANIDNIHQFKTDTIGLGTGVTLHLRGELRKNIQKTRLDLYRAGAVKAIGYCRRCKEEVEPDLDLDCPNNKSHGKVEKVRFFL